MTTIHASSPISDEISIIKDGGEILEFKYSFMPSVTLIKRFRQLQVAMIEAQKQPGDAEVAAVGIVVVDFFTMIFGKENTERILEFYANKYDVMLMDLYPHILTEIIPKVEQSTRNAKRALRAKYRR